MHHKPRQKEGNRVQTFYTRAVHKKLPPSMKRISTSPEDCKRTMELERPKRSEQFVDTPRSVLVGNIPCEATAEQVKELFSQVGPVVSCRLVFNKETGKHKGYGFVEFMNSMTALAAVQNLNGSQIHGKELRVYYAEK